MDVEKIKAKLLAKKKAPVIKGSDYLSTGSTLLDLACSDSIKGGLLKGKFYFFVGDSSSGKTWLSMTCLAEAAINPNFNDYRFIYDNGEDGALMDIEKYFGKAVARRLESPAKDSDGNPVHSTSVEEFYYHVDDAIKAGKPFIYILDSMDSLSSDDEISKFTEAKEAHRKGKEVAGSYGDGKAKKNSANLRKLISPLRDSNSILIILCQTRDNLGFGFEKKTRSGGKALRFYACLEMWSSVKKKIVKIVREKKRQLGVESLIEIKKNRITGKERSIVIPIYHSSGIDNIGSCVDYLMEEGHWEQKGNSIVVPEFDFKGLREKLIKYIEDNNLEDQVKQIVQTVWDDIEEACAVKRKKRYE